MHLAKLLVLLTVFLCPEAAFAVKFHVQFCNAEFSLAKEVQARQLSASELQSVANCEQASLAYLLRVVSLGLGGSRGVLPSPQGRVSTQLESAFSALHAGLLDGQLDSQESTMLLSSHGTTGALALLAFKRGEWTSELTVWRESRGYTLHDADVARCGTYCRHLRCLTIGATTTSSASDRVEQLWQAKCDLIVLFGILPTSVQNSMVSLAQSGGIEPQQTEFVNQVSAALNRSGDPRVSQLPAYQSIVLTWIDVSPYQAGKVDFRSTLVAALKNAVSRFL